MTDHPPWQPDDEAWDEERIAAIAWTGPVPTPSLDEEA